MKIPPLFAFITAFTLLIGLTPPASAAPTVGAASAGTKTVGYSTSVWGTVSEPHREVWTDVWLGSGWSRSQVGTTDSRGRYALELTYGFTSEGRYRFRVGSRTSAGVVYSPEFTLTRTPWQPGWSRTKPVGEATNTWATLPAAAGRTVWTEALVNGRWSRSQVRTANSSGYFAIPLTYGTNDVGHHTFRVGASTAFGTVYSTAFVLERTGRSYRVDAYSAGTKQVNEATNAWGTVHGHGGGQVSTQVLVGGRWSTSQVGRSNSNGSFALPLTYGASNAGTYTFRVAASTPVGTVYSNQFTLTRTAPAAPSPSNVGQELLTAVNRERAAGAVCGTTSMPPVRALTWNSKLAQAAQRHSDDMARNGFASHTGSDGSTPGDRIAAAGYARSGYGENVAAGQRTVAEVMRAWMDSPGHCRNIMNGSFREFGGAKATNFGTVYVDYWTQVFGIPR
jgi:uncharacterized protein YkwD